jgi:DNA adenine methylase
LRTCNTFGSTGKGKLYKDSNPYNKTKNIQEYKDRMKNTTMLSQDYKKVIKNHDSTKTLFYLDPPYEKSDDLYKNSDMNYEELSELLSSIKGKFVLSINDSIHMRKTFNQFKIKQISVHTQGNKGIGSGGDRIELIIKNF